MPVAQQEGMIRIGKEVQPKAFDVVERLEWARTEFQQGH